MFQTSRRYRRAGVLSLLCLLASLTLPAQAPQTAPSTLDSLYLAYQADGNPHEKLFLLRQIVKFHWQKPEEVTIWQKIIDLSFSIDSLTPAYEAMGSLCRYYFNADKMDSVYYWRAQIDSISSSRNDCPDALFKIGFIICTRQVWEQNYELAMDETMRQLARAKEKNQPYGLMLAHHNKAYILQAIGRDSDAVVAFREGMKWFPQSMRDSLFVQQYLGEMIESTLRLDYLDESEQLLKRYRRLVEASEQKFKANNLPFPTPWQRWNVYSYLADLAARRGQLKKAKEYIDRVSLDVDTTRDENLQEMKFPYYHALALYYNQIRDHARAIEAVDKAYSVRNRLGLLAFKASLLRKAGRDDEAIATYKRLFVMSDSTRNEALSRQIRQIYSINNINDREKQERDLQSRNEQVAVRQRLLVFLGCLLGGLIITLYFLSCLYKRSCRLKRELTGEKKSLIETEKDLVMAKEDAEKANREKSAFIASISHEIRTPLNAIVGFSELLTDDAYDEEEKIRFASHINTNSELLMTLINDVLDLSRLESGNYHVSFKPCDVVACCRRALDSMRHRVDKEVELRFDSPVDSYMLRTDSLRVQQLLVNLLTNAAKFTCRGSITLSLEIDEEARQVQFAVTDTGCGIPEDKFNAVFQHFEKLDEFQQGTGLGLPICRNIALRLNGKLFIDPAYKDGARFVFIHPIEAS